MKAAKGWVIVMFLDSEAKSQGFAVDDALSTKKVRAKVVDIFSSDSEEIGVESSDLVIIYRHPEYEVEFEESDNFYIVCRKENIAVSLGKEIKSEK